MFVFTRSKACLQRFVPANWDVMFRTLVHVCVFLVGLLAVCWVGIGYLGSNPLGACVAAVIGACYVAGALGCIATARLLRRWKRQSMG